MPWSRVAAARANARAEKIHAMLARRPPWLLRAAIAWPVEPLYAGPDRASFVGFVMPARRGTPTKRTPA